MKSLLYPLGIGLLITTALLTACSKSTEPKPFESAVTTQEKEPEVPMSAEPAEPTGVMNTEPVPINEASGQAMEEDGQQPQ